jgi:hypothetical protein
MRLSGWGGQAPDAQVVDVMKAEIPLRLAALDLIWGTVALLGAWGQWTVDSKMETYRDFQRKVRDDVRAESVPVPVRNDALGLLEIQDGMFKILQGGFAMMVGLGALGIGVEVVSFTMTRRLLATGSAEPGHRFLPGPSGRTETEGV